MPMEVIEKHAVPMAQVKAELASIKERDTELSFRSAKVEEYLNDFVKLKCEEAKELFDKIMALSVPRLKDVHAAKIVDLLPKSSEELKLFLQGYTITVSKEHLEAIVAAVADYIPKK